MVKKHILWEKENTNVFTVDISCAWKVIKFISVFCMCLALFTGCGEADLDSGDPISDNLPNLDDPKVREQILAEAIDEDNLQTRQSPSGEELFYAPNQEVPYTGWVKDTSYKDDIPFALWQVQNGKRHGIYLEWYSTQQNEEKGFYKDGVKDGTWTYWYENGQKQREGPFKDGAENGLWTFWNSDGQKYLEGTFKVGFESGLWTIWNSDGQKYDALIHDQTGVVAFSPDGRTLASGSDDGTIRLWDVETWTHKHTLNEHTEYVNCVVFSPDSRTLASRSWSHNIICLWDVNTGTHILTHNVDHNSSANVAFSPDGRTIASAASRSDVYVWDVETGALIQRLTGHQRDTEGVAFSPDGHTLASVDSFNIHLWNVAPWFHKRSIRVDDITDVVFSPDGRTLTSPRGVFRLWDVETGRNIHTPIPADVRGVALSPDGLTFASASDGIGRLWDVETGKLKHTLEVLHHVDGAAFSPDGRTLASAGFGIIRLWDVP